MNKKINFFEILPLIMLVILSIINSREFLKCAEMGVSVLAYVIASVMFLNIAFIFCVIIYGKCKNKEFVKEADE